VGHLPGQIVHGREEGLYRLAEAGDAGGPLVRPVERQPAAFAVGLGAAPERLEVDDGHLVEGDALGAQRRRDPWLGATVPSGNRLLTPSNLSTGRAISRVHTSQASLTIATSPA
jgi:hypothetical protein